MDQQFVLPQPWWVGIAVLVPIALYAWWRKAGIRLPARALAAAAVFGIAFGFVEAAAVVYLQLALGLLPAGQMFFFGAYTLLPVYDAEVVAQVLHASVFFVEIAREAATLVMLAAVAALSASRRKERAAVFFWCAAWWDIWYYASLWLIIRWPRSLTTPDILFLIPEPWIGPVWFPLLVSCAVLWAVLAARRSCSEETLSQKRRTEPPHAPRREHAPSGD